MRLAERGAAFGILLGPSRPHPCTSPLQGLGFEFGEVAQMTDEWEHRFDQLIDWMLWHKENQQRFSWLGIDWGHRGGITGACLRC